MSDGGHSMSEHIFASNGGYCLYASVWHLRFQGSIHQVTFLFLFQENAFSWSLCHPQPQDLL